MFCFVLFFCSVGFLETWSRRSCLCVCVSLWSLSHWVEIALPLAKFLWYSIASPKVFCLVSKDIPAICVAQSSALIGSGFEMHIISPRVRFPYRDLHLLACAIFWQWGFHTVWALLFELTLTFFLCFYLPSVHKKLQSIGWQRFESRIFGRTRTTVDVLWSI